MKYITLSILALATVLLVGCAERNSSAGGSGFIESDEVTVSAETSGRTTELRIDEGDVVTKDDTLAVIDTTRLALQLRAARSGRNVAKQHLSTARIGVEQAASSEEFAQTEFDRVSRLRESGTATQRQYDQAKQALDQAGLALRSARASVSSIEAELDRIDAEIALLERRFRDCLPLSPLSGTALETFVEVGELLAPGKPIVRIARLDTVWVKVYLGAAAFAKVKLGDSATVDTESGEGTLTGTVAWTSDEAEFTPKNVQTEESRADLVYAVKVRVANPNRTLKIGMPVFVTLVEQ